jgi:hypothetical protein
MRPEHRIHWINQAMAALVEVVHAGRLSYADAEAIVASVATLYEATPIPRADVTGQYFTKCSMFELSRYQLRKRHGATT